MARRWGLDLILWPVVSGCEYMSAGCLNERGMCVPLEGRAALSRQPDLYPICSTLSPCSAIPQCPTVPAPTVRQRPFNALAPRTVKLLEHTDSVACDSAVIHYGSTKRLSLMNSGWCPRAPGACWCWGYRGTTHRSLPWRSREGNDKCSGSYGNRVV